MKNKPRLLRITTVPISLKFLLRGQLTFFRQQGFEVLAVSADGPEVADLQKEGIEHRTVAMTRQITPFRDLVCLWQLIRLIRKFKPHIVHTHTPKAGLLGMLAAWICHVPVRLHTVAGLPLMEARGMKRWLLIGTEKITYACAQYVYPNSMGLKTFLHDRLSVNETLVKVIGKGSTNGIDVSYFTRTPALQQEADRLRERYGITQNDCVFCFVGRIVKDKGMRELVGAFKKLIATERNDRPGAPRFFLLLVGPFEQELDPLDEEDYAFLQSHPSVILAGYQGDVRPWIIASDIFVFPSYREGFPNVVMQACCLEVPCIVSDINGCNEIIQHGKTGLIVPPKNTEALYQAMRELLNSPDSRKDFAREARAFIAENFSQHFVWAALLDEYRLQLRRCQDVKPEAAEV